MVLTRIGREEEPLRNSSALHQPEAVTYSPDPYVSLLVRCPGVDSGASCPACERPEATEDASLRVKIPQAAACSGNRPASKAPDEGYLLVDIRLVKRECICCHSRQTPVEKSYP